MNQNLSPEELRRLRDTAAAMRLDASHPELTHLADQVLQGTAPNPRAAYEAIV